MSPQQWRVPTRIETARLVLRRYVPEDAAQMSAVTLASKAHLVPWMPWARAEPLSPTERAELIERFAAEFEAGIDFSVGIFTHAGTYVGGTGFHTRRGPGILEIGYWIAADETRKGYATEVAAALTQVALGPCGAERVEILHHPDNVASGAVPARLGFTYEGDEVVHVAGVEDAEPVSVWAATGALVASGALSGWPAPVVTW